MKKIVSFVMSLLLMLSLLPVGAAAIPATDSVTVNGITLSSGYCLASADAAPAAIGEPMPASYAMYEDGVLTLKDFQMLGDKVQYGIYSANDLTVVLEGDNVIGGEAKRPSMAAIYSEKTLAIQGDGSLTVRANYAGLYSGGELVIKNGTIESEGAIYAIRANGGLTVSGGTITAAATSAAILCGSSATISGGTIESEGDMYGIWVNGDLTVSGGKIGLTCDQAGIVVYGTLVVSGGEIRATDGFDAIFCTNKIEISGGTVESYGRQSGIHVQGPLIVSGGTINASGDTTAMLCHGNVTISGGTVNAVADVMGINVFTGDLTVNGGSLSADADTIAIECSGGDVIVNGGTLAASSEDLAIYAADIKLGSGVAVTEGGTVRNIFYASYFKKQPYYYKIEVKDGATHYYKRVDGSYFTLEEEEFTDATSGLKEEDWYHEQVATVPDADDFDYDMLDVGFVGASTKVVIGAGSAEPPKKSGKEKTDRGDDEQIITGKIVSYEKLSRLSDDYKAMKAYAAALGLGDALVVGTWDIEPKGLGPWKIVFHLGGKYLGDTLTIIHKKDDGTFETYAAVVDESGEAAITVASASPFLVLRGEGAAGAAAGSSAGASATEENPNTGFDFSWGF